MWTPNGAQYALLLVIKTDYDLYAGKVDANGVVQGGNGVAICAAIKTQLYPQIISDGNGGAIMTWVDSRNSATTGDDIYAQKVKADGSPGE